MMKTNSTATKKIVPIVAAGASNDANNQASTQRIPQPKDRLSDELIIAVVGPIGSGCTETCKNLKEYLEKEYNYDIKLHKPSELIANSLRLKHPQQSIEPQEFSVPELQAEGTKLRNEKGAAYWAAKLIQTISADRDQYERKKRSESSDANKSGEIRATNRRVAHIIDSLKHPEEFDLLKQTYGSMFWLIGVFAPEEVRKNRLKEKIRSKNPTYDEVQLDPQVQLLMSSDYKEQDERGQAVRDLFFQADYFVNNGGENDSVLKVNVDRFLESIFGFPIKTPSIDESSMYAAYAQAARSACMSRQVGASIVDGKGLVIGLGRNDVPKYGGGLYDEGDGAGDNRCFRWGRKICHNQARKNTINQKILELVKPSAVDKINPQIKGIGINGLLEFSRSIHAEMEAILSVARNGTIGLVGATLYTTTFPCHNCARHIIAAGIEKVIFIEPFPKSEALALHHDALVEPKSGGDSQGKYVRLVQYSGFAPKKLLEIFSFGGLSRKNPDGHLHEFDKKSATPRVRSALDSFSTLEKFVVSGLNGDE